MSGLREHFSQLLQAPGGVLNIIASVVISWCVVLVFAAVFINFALCGGKSGVKREKRSVVATGSMTLFFVFFYLLIRFRIGNLLVANFSLHAALVVIGLAIIVFGCCVNLAGRLRLGKNWANQVTIYQDQKLVTTGIYRYVRHPLYASLIWMFYGASIVYASWAAFLANTLIFLPFMIHRARQEEELLAREFSDYEDYKRRVGMFFFKGGFS